MDFNFKKSLLFASLTLTLTTECTSVALFDKPISGYDQGQKANGKGLNARLQDLVELKADSIVSLSSILQMEVSNGQYIVRDDNGVYSFDRTGKRICRFGEKGHGRGEYVNLSCFFVKGNGNVCIIDDYKQSVMEYSRDGHFVSEKKAPDGTFSYIGTSIALPDKNAIFCSFMANPENDEFCAEIDEDFKKNVIYKSELKSTRTSEMIGRHPISIFDGIVRCVRPYDNCIYTYGEEFPTSVTIPKSIISTTSDEEKRNYTYLSLLNEAIKDKFVGFTDIFETDRFIMLGVSNYDYVMIDKEKAECAHHKYSIPEKATNTPLINIMAADELHLYGVLTPINAYTCNKTIMRNKDFKRIAEAMNRVKETDNPVILVYYMPNKKGSTDTFRSND